MRTRGSQFLTSAQIDTSKALVGSGPSAGDMSSTGIRVPQQATTAQNLRYQFQLFSMDVPPGHIGIIHSLHQMLYIGTELEEELDQPDAKWLIEIPVTDPMWSFPDGNVSWHLRACEVATPDITFYTDHIFGAPYSNRADATDSCLLARRPAGGPYVPLNGGAPFGKGIAGLGTFRDMRYPWHESTEQSLGIVIDSPMHVVLYASVYQTDPNRRPNKPVGIETAGLRPEDVFMLNYPEAKYTRVGGRIKFEIQPMTNSEKKGAI